MAEKHPNELELLSFVEEELSADERQEVAEHLVACRSCSQHVRRLEAGRGALRASPLLELPEERRREILAALPERREPRRSFRPLKRALVIAAPVAAAAALVGVFVLGGTQLGGGGDADEAAREGAATAAEMQAEAEDSGGVEEAAPEAAHAGELVRSVEGPAAEVVNLLRREGIPAVVDPGGSVTAQGALADVRAALLGRPAGDVAVYVR